MKQHHFTLISHACDQTHYTKARLVPFNYVYTLVKIHIWRYLRTLTYKNPDRLPAYTSSPVYSSTIIHIPLSMLRPFTCTRKQLSHHSQKSTQDKSHFLISCPSVTLYLISHPVVGSLHLVMHGVTGNLNVPRHRNVNLLFRSILLQRF